MSDFWYNKHSASEAQFWGARTSLDAYMLHEGTVAWTTVYESPTRPYWYSLDHHQAGVFGQLFFAGRKEAYEQLIRNLDTQIAVLERCRNVAAETYEELFSAEEFNEPSSDAVPRGDEGGESPQPCARGADHRAR